MEQVIIRIQEGDILTVKPNVHGFIKKVKVVRIIKEGVEFGCVDVETKEFSKVLFKDVLGISNATVEDKQVRRDPFSMNQPVANANSDAIDLTNPDTWFTVDRSYFILNEDKDSGGDDNDEENDSEPEDGENDGKPKDGGEDEGEGQPEPGEGDQEGEDGEGGEASAEKQEGEGEESEGQGQDGEAQQGGKPSSEDMTEPGKETDEIIEGSDEPGERGKSIAAPEHDHNLTTDTIKVTKKKRF